MGIIRTSARALIRRGDELLVVRYLDEQGPWYVLPGGGQHHQESLTAALQREVEEETGARVRVGPLRFVRECVAGPGSRGVPPNFHQVELVFVCELLTAATGGTGPDPSQTSVEWQSIDVLRRASFFPQALLDALDDGEDVAYLGVV